MTRSASPPRATSSRRLPATAGRSTACWRSAGWSPGQLEREIADNAWLAGPADRQILFDTPVEARWGAAVKRLGVDLAALSSEAGHA
jgi:putative AlgH/UPF0301 family transcriptional regulator